MKKSRARKREARPTGTALEDPRHLRRWMLAQQVGGSEEAAAKAVAAKEHISVTAARQSIRRVEEYNLRNERGRFDLAVRDLVIDSMPIAKSTLQGLLTATELVEVRDEKTGRTKTVKVEDKTTRLEGMRIVKDLISVQQPKGPMIEQTIAQTTQVATQVGSSETFEERLKRLREKAKAHNQLPPETAGVPEYIDAGDDAEEDDSEEDEDNEDS